jgi:hypothetical protein
MLKHQFVQGAMRDTAKPPDYEAHVSSFAVAGGSAAP